MAGNSFRKKCLCALLAAVMTLTAAGCGKSEDHTSQTVGENVTGGSAGSGESGKEENGGEKNEENSGAKGRYIETQIVPPEDFQGRGKMTVLSDGSIGLLNFETGTKSTSQDAGKSWTTTSVPELEALLEEGNTLMGAMAPDGGILVYYVVWDNSSEEKLVPERYLYLAPDGTKAEFELGLEEYTESAADAVFGGNGQLFLYTQGGRIYEVSLQEQTAEEVVELNESFDLDMCTDQSGLFVQNGQKGFYYPLEGGETDAGDEVLNSFLREQTGKRQGIASALETLESGEHVVYLACGDGIYRHVMGGSSMEQLADGALNRLGDPSGVPVDLLRLDGDIFLILYSDGGIYSYEYDPEASIVPEKQVIVYSLWDNETVRRAIGVFRKENPDVYVRLEIGLTGEDGMTEEDAIHNLNTRLLAGDGPDLLLLDGMPVASYEEKGILMDLSGEVEALKAEGNFYENILESYRREDGIYALPFRYSISFLCGPREAVENAGDLNSLADAAEKLSAEGQSGMVFGTCTPEMVLERLYPLCAGAWEKGEEADKQALLEFLTAAQRIYDSELQNLTEEEKAFYEEQMRSTESYYAEAGFSAYEIQKMNTGIAYKGVDVMAGLYSMLFGEAYSMEDYRSVVSLCSEKTLQGEEWCVQNFEGQLPGSFRPTGIVGICAAAKEPEIAKQFLRALFLTEVQGTDLGDGFPVNADAFSDFSEDPYPGSDIGYGVSTPEGETIHFTVHWPTEEELSNLQNIISTLQTPVSAETVLRDDVIAIGAKALTGEKDINECVEEIAGKLSLRMQE